MDWGKFISAFGLVFVAELGDKTQLAVVTQTCKHRRPWAVFAGASAALIAVTALGAVGGRLLGGLIPEEVLGTVAAGAFVVMGLLVAREAWKVGTEGQGEQWCDNPGDGQRDCSPISAWNWQAFSSTLGLLFVAELGDKTQLAVLSLASRQGSVWPAFVGGALALTVVTALGVVGGQGLCKLLPERVLLWASAVTFVTMGGLMALGVL
jgi:putative Ca2+/H+ antiporter (TMEM165/GDT1 family)